MKRGGKFLVSTTMLALAGCGGEQGKLEIRSTPTPLAQGQKPVPYRIAEARGQLALGNVALALEAFRIAYREDPNSTDALLGIAACYDQMGRYDLSRRNYETALALVPSDLQILGAFASSLQLQGRTDEALSVRREMAARASVAAAKEQQLAQVPAPMRNVPQPLPVVVPPAETAVTAEVAAPPALAQRTWTTPEVNISAPALERVGVEVAIAEPASIELEAAEEPAARPMPTEAPVHSASAKPVVQTAAVGQSVTIKLPKARPVQEVPAPTVVAPVTVATPAETPEPQAPAGSLQIAAMAPLKPYVRPVAEPAVTEERGPRLERMSMGEIALITVPKPVWRSTTVAQDGRSTKVRFVPLRQASTLPVKVRLLNAARVNRLAARTRTWLTDRGWRGLAIGDATVTRSRSIIYYPEHKRVLARRLSAQFGFALAPRASGSHIVVLLGSDAARHPAIRSVSA